MVSRWCQPDGRTAQQDGAVRIVRRWDCKPRRQEFPPSNCRPWAPNVTHAPQANFSGGGLTLDVDERYRTVLLQLVYVVEVRASGTSRTFRSAVLFRYRATTKVFFIQKGSLPERSLVASS